MPRYGRTSLTRILRHDYYAGLCAIFAGILLAVVGAMTVATVVRTYAKGLPDADRTTVAGIAGGILALLALGYLLLGKLRVKQLKKRFGPEEPSLPIVCQHLYEGFTICCLGGVFIYSLMCPQEHTQPNPITPLVLASLASLLVILVALTVSRIRKLSQCVTYGRRVEGVVVGNIYTEMQSRESRIAGGGAITYEWSTRGKCYSGMHVLWNSKIAQSFMPSDPIELAEVDERAGEAIPTLFYALPRSTASLQRRRM